MDDRLVLEQAKEAILEAGQTALKYWKSGVVQVEKTVGYGIVTEADQVVEELLKGWIRANFPGDSIVAEESGGNPSGNFWTIDPIDGTQSFARSLQDWSISIAHFIDGEAILGLTLCPPTGELFYAAKGEGAFVNGQPIRVSTVGAHKRSIINIGHDVIRLQNRVDIEEEVIKSTAAHRIVGSTALALAWLASGRIDQAVHTGQSIWDIAAASVLIPEAGGVFRRWDNGPLDCTGAIANDIYASNGVLPEDWSFLE